VGWVHRSWRFGHAKTLREVGPEIPERGQSPEKLLDFISAGAIQIISCQDWRPWKKPGYITMTRWQSNSQWSGGIKAHPAPKNFEYKNPLEIFSPRFFGNQEGIVPIDYFPKGQTINAAYYLSPLVQLKDFWRKNTARSSPKGSCFCTTMPRLTGHLQPRRNWPTWAYNILITNSILRIWPRRNTICSWTEKTIEISTFFVRHGGECCRGDLVERPKFWIFLSGLQMLEKRGKKCSELRGDYIE
jgi:hypothetical protein